MELHLHVVRLNPYPVNVLPGLLQCPDKVIAAYACGITVWIGRRQEQDVWFLNDPRCLGAAYHRQFSAAELTPRPQGSAGPPWTSRWRALYSRKA